MKIKDQIQKLIFVTFICMMFIVSFYGLKVGGSFVSPKKYALYVDMEFRSLHFPNAEQAESLLSLRVERLLREFGAGNSLQVLTFSDRLIASFEEPESFHVEERRAELMSRVQELSSIPLFSGMRSQVFVRKSEGQSATGFTFHGPLEELLFTAAKSPQEGLARLKKGGLFSLLPPDLELVCCNELPSGAASILGARPLLKAVNDISGVEKAVGAHFTIPSHIIEYDSSLLSSEGLSVKGFVESIKKTLASEDVTTFQFLQRIQLLYPEKLKKLEAVPVLSASGKEKQLSEISILNLKDTFYEVFDENRLNDVATFQKVNQNEVLLPRIRIYLDSHANRDSIASKIEQHLAANGYKKNWTFRNEAKTPTHFFQREVLPFFAVSLVVLGEILRRYTKFSFIVHWMGTSTLAMNGLLTLAGLTWSFASLGDLVLFNVLGIFVVCVRTEALRSLVLERTPFLARFSNSIFVLFVTFAISIWLAPAENYERSFHLTDTAVALLASAFAGAFHTSAPFRYTQSKVEVSVLRRRELLVPFFLLCIVAGPYLLVQNVFQNARFFQRLEMDRSHERISAFAEVTSENSRNLMSEGSWLVPIASKVLRLSGEDLNMRESVSLLDEIAARSLQVVGYIRTEAQAPVPVFAFDKQIGESLSLSKAQLLPFQPMVQSHNRTVQNVGFSLPQVGYPLSNVQSEFTRVHEGLFRHEQRRVLIGHGREPRPEALRATVPPRVTEAHQKMRVEQGRLVFWNSLLAWIPFVVVFGAVLLIIASGIFESMKRGILVCMVYAVSFATTLLSLSPGMSTGSSFLRMGEECSRAFFTSLFLTALWMSLVSISDLFRRRNCNLERVCLPYVKLSQFSRYFLFVPLLGFLQEVSDETVTSLLRQSSLLVIVVIFFPPFLFLTMDIGEKFMRIWLKRLVRASVFFLFLLGDFLVPQSALADGKKIVEASCSGDIYMVVPIITKPVGRAAPIVRRAFTERLMQGLPCSELLPWPADVLDKLMDEHSEGKGATQTKIFEERLGHALAQFLKGKNGEPKLSHAKSGKRHIVGGFAEEFFGSIAFTLLDVTFESLEKIQTRKLTGLEADQTKGAGVLAEEIRGAIEEPTGVLLEPMHSRVFVKMREREKAGPDHTTRMADEIYRFVNRNLSKPREWPFYKRHPNLRVVKGREEAETILTLEVDREGTRLFVSFTVENRISGKRRNGWFEGEVNQFGTFEEGLVLAIAEAIDANEGHHDSLVGLSAGVFARRNQRVGLSVLQFRQNLGWLALEVAGGRGTFSDETAYGFAVGASGQWNINERMRFDAGLVGSYFFEKNYFSSTPAQGKVSFISFMPKSRLTIYNDSLYFEFWGACLFLSRESSINPDIKPWLAFPGLGLGVGVLL
jgi:hypothetical protein